MLILAKSFFLELVPQNEGQRQTPAGASHDFTVGKYRAGQVLGWGRRTTDEAVAEGKMPVIDGAKPTVSTA
jgi:hypothetical protein